MSFITDFILGRFNSDLEDFQKFKKEIDIPIYVMIRPRGEIFLFYCYYR